MRLTTCAAFLVLLSLTLAGCETNPFDPATYRHPKSAPAAAVAQPATTGTAAMKIAVSVRHYYATERRSYFHLILYAGDGTLLRPLTRLEGVNDMAPVISPDGKQVCFERKTIAKDVKAREGYYLIADIDNPAEETRVPQAPPWYRPKNDGLANQGVFMPNEGKGLAQGEPFAQRFSSPEGRFETIVHYNFREDKGQSDGGGGFAGDVTFRLADRASSATERMARLSGFQGLTQAWLIDGTPYLYAGPLKVAFFCRHIGSTDGTAFYALDLSRKTFIELSPNGGTAVPIRGVPGFFVVNEERYQDLGDGKTRVNCKYLDFWDGELKRTRFAPKISNFGGAAVYMPGHGVTVIP